MKQILCALTAAALLSTAALNAQSPHNGHDHNDLIPCGTDQQMARVFAENPQLKAEFEAREAEAEAADRAAFATGYMDNTRSVMPPVYIIPIVFHIIHNYGAENISDAQIIDQVRILNEDFRKLNADTSLVVPGFQGIVADAEIEFRLANLDPNGNCTNGIDRIVSQETYIGDDGSKLNYWPRANYLNVWVVNTISSGAAGYAYLPGTAPSASVDGIMILSTYIGSIGTGNPGTSRALTHEIGHFLNLQHTWGSTNNPGVSCGNDGVSDTPITEGWTSCNLTNNDVCNPGIDENVQNFMEYAYCSRMFTTGQRTRMRSALTSSVASRSTLWSAANLTATGVNNNPPNVCAPEADFKPGSIVTICAGGSVAFTDQSWKGTPTSWSWSFPGGTPSTSTSQNPTITYSTPGVYSVTLTASNASGSDAFTRTNFVQVLSSSAQYSNSTYVEGMENASTFSSDWTIVNPGGNGWVRSTATAFTGAACVRYDNTSNSGGQIEELIGSTINMSAIANPVFTFRVAYALRATGDNDRLRVLVSTNCGQTWTQRYAKSGSILATAPTTSGSFTPNASQWRLETVSLNSSLQSATNVRIKFEFESDGGNDVYIDDINIVSPTSVSSPDLNISQFTVFPNPAQENTTAMFTLTESMQTDIQVIDLTGREVMAVYSGELQPGEHRFDLNTAALSKGIYFVRLRAGNGFVTQKLVVE